MNLESIPDSVRILQLGRAWNGVLHSQISLVDILCHHRLTNNIVEYEACIIGLEIALDHGVRHLEIHGDSNLVIQQAHGIWRTRDEKLKAY